MKKLIFLFFVIALTGCEYELSPWETDPHCPGVSVAENLARLAAFEESIGKVDSYRVAVIGDPQQYPGAFEDTIEHINTLKDVHFTLVVGDLAETGVKAEFEWMCKAMSKSDIPMIAVVGNHDAISFGQDIWLDVFGDFDFAFTYQNTRFVAYNDNQYEFGVPPDRDWLHKEAQPLEGEADFDHIIGVSHVPPWDDNEGFDESLSASGYELTVHGHESSFDFWQRDDVGLPHYITTQNRDPGFGMITISPDLDLQVDNCTRECTQTTPRVVATPIPDPQ
jgi:3',5'-cyclic AMP phosphodiesterase CpdA